MAEAYFSSNKKNSVATFELFFRKCPFGGEYAVLAGYDLVRDILQNFRFSETDLDYLKSLSAFKNTRPDFFEALRTLDFKDVEILGIQEGEIVFPRTPLLQIRGPLYKTQLLESALLNAINFSTLVATYARRIRLVAGERSLVEFGLRRAQGPNGAMTAARSAYLGGFDATSNVLAGKNLGIPVVGTMAHSFIQSFWAVSEADLIWNGKNISTLFEKIKNEDGLSTNEGELGAFLAYAKAFPDNALLLVDTYNVLGSGIPNAIRIFKLLREMGHKNFGIRLDSGDLVYFSKQARQILDAAGFRDAKIFASNELDENIISSIQDQGAVIDSYGVGTHLVTALPQPALGGVYKLVELDSRPRMKISQQTEKLVLPCAKSVYRMIGKDEKMIADILMTCSEPAPVAGSQQLALHPADAFKRALIAPTKVEPLLQPLFAGGKFLEDKSLSEKRSWSLKRMEQVRPDITRQKNPTPYKVSISAKLKSLVDELYNQESPPIHLE